MEVSIKNPTTTRAGAVAKDGIAKKIGDRNKDKPNKMAATTAVKPVLPPSETPEALYTKVVVVEVPNNAPRENTLEKSSLKNVGAMLLIPKPEDKSGNTLYMPSSGFG